MNSRYSASQCRSAVSASVHNGANKEQIVSIFSYFLLVKWIRNRHWLCSLGCDFVAVTSVCCSLFIELT